MSMTFKDITAGIGGVAGIAFVGWFTYEVATGDAGAERVEMACGDIVSLATKTFRARAEGMTEDEALDILREAQVYGGIQAWAVDQAFRAPADTPEWMFSGSVFKECKKRGGV